MELGKDGIRMPDKYRSTYLDYERYKIFAPNLVFLVSYITTKISKTDPQKSS